jgi:hypothetical protein
MGVTISAPRIHHQPSQAFVHRLEEPVEGQSGNISIVAVNRSLRMPSRKSVSCAAILLAVALELPATNSLVGM